MISEGSCNTEDWRNGSWIFSFAITGINFILKYIKIKSCFKLKYFTTVLYFWSNKYILLEHNRFLSKYEILLLNIKIKYKKIWIIPNYWPVMYIIVKSSFQSYSVCFCVSSLADRKQVPVISVWGRTTKQKPEYGLRQVCRRAAWSDKLVSVTSETSHSMRPKWVQPWDTT